MRTALHSRVARQASQLLQDIQGCTALNVPTGPGVPQVVPAKVLDARAAQGLVPSSRAHPTSGLPLNVNTTSRCLPICFCRTATASPLRGTGIARLAFASSGCAHASRRSGSTADQRSPVTFAALNLEERLNAERGHVAQMLGQFCGQPIGLQVSQIPDATDRLLEHSHRRRPIQPLPRPCTLSKNRSHERKCPVVDRGTAAAVIELGL